MKYLKDVSLAGKRVLMRVDFNVPLDGAAITDDGRIRACLPSIRHVIDSGGRLVLMSHLGRPKGERQEKFSLRPAAARLSELIGKPVGLLDDCIGPAVEDRVSVLADGEAVMLENLRFHKAETDDDDAFGKALANLCDVYVNEAFAVSHRANASVSSVTRHAPVSVAGFLLENELDAFEKAMQNPERPLAAVIGGAKVSGKLELLSTLLEKVDKLIIGGAMANTFLLGMGYDMARSRVETDLAPMAKEVVDKARAKGVKLYLPVDIVGGDRMEEEAVAVTAPVQEIPEDLMALDIGPATGMLYSEALRDAKTILWNGPMGVFEMSPFSRGTMTVARALAGSDAFTVVGGGDTAAAVRQAGVEEAISYISTGGGAFLELMEGRTLPAVAALEAADA